MATSAHDIAALIAAASPDELDAAEAQFRGIYRHVLKNVLAEEKEEKETLP